MQEARIAVRLASLLESPGYTVRRFDDGPPLSGTVAVLPSAFNPPTRAHLRLLELAGSEAGVSAVATVLSTSNVDKAVFGAPLAHRVGMLLALRADTVAAPAVLVTNAARLVDQGEALRVRYPGVEFDFVAGFDTLVRVFDQKYYERMDDALARFFAHHRLIATNRAQASVDAVQSFMETPEARPWASRVVVRELDPGHAAMSSSAVRGEAVRGEDSEALTEGVRTYIARHGLYGAGDESVA